MLHLETRIYFTLSSVVLYEFPQYEFPQAVRLYEFPQPVPVLDLASYDVENISSTCRLSLSCLFNNHEREREREREICSANGPQE